MISKTCAIECVGRLSLLRRFPTNNHAIGELGRILGEICESDAEATALVSVVLEDYDEWPGPHQLRDTYASAIAKPKIEENLPPFCEHCQDMAGFRDALHIVESMPDGSRKKQLIVLEGTRREASEQRREICKRYWNDPATQVYDVVTECKCERGKIQSERRKAAERKRRP